MIVESNVPLQPYNSFGIVARAQHLLRIADEADLVALHADAGDHVGLRWSPEDAHAFDAAGQRIH